MKETRRKKTVQGLMAWLDREAARVPLDRALERPYYRTLTFDLTVNGDESFSRAAILDLYWRVVHDKLEHADRAVLALFLSRLNDSAEGRKIVAGVEGRGGQAKRGAIGLTIAANVAELMRAQGLTAEQAWAQAGETHHLSASAVKGHWMKWKPRLLEGAKEYAKSKFPDATQEELDVIAKVGVLGAKANLSSSEARIWGKVMVKHHSGDD